MICFYNDSFFLEFHIITCERIVIVMPYLYTYRLFISHAWRYGSDYDRLVTLLNNANNFSYYNYSAPRERPLFPQGTPVTNAEIARMITAKIKPAQVVIVLCGMYAAHSDWMKYEVDEAVRMGKPIIAVAPWGQTNCPSYVLERASTLVHWNTQSIVTAIRNLV